jgi:hypothetical protein
MSTGESTVHVKGRAVQFVSVSVGTRTIFATGRFLRIAEVKDAEWLDGDDLEDPEFCIGKIKQANIGADILTFAQKLPHVQPKHNYSMEWDSIAAINTSDYLQWWEHRTSQAFRKNVRRSEKRGLCVRETMLSDELVAGIVDIHNETPIRQGRRFWHYGKSFNEVKEVYSSMPERSTFIGAYDGQELVGFIKLVYGSEAAGILHLLCKNSHNDKRPANALVARAVEICSKKGLNFLTYGRYVYGKRTDSPLTEFKRRNGFEEILVPRYFVPLNAKGRIALQTGLHHGVKYFLPKRVVDFGVKVRAYWYEKTLIDRSHDRVGHDLG